MSLAIKKSAYLIWIHNHYTYIHTYISYIFMAFINRSPASFFFMYKNYK